MSNNIACVHTSLQQICTDNDSRAYIDLYRSLIDYYDKLINGYKEDKRQERIKMARFILGKINKTDIMEKYRQPGMVVVCEDLIFICNNDLEFQYANWEDEI